MVVNNYPYLAEVKMVAPVNMLAYRDAEQMKELLAVFLQESERHLYSSLRFPSKAVSVREHQVQNQNYDYFLHTMAEMVQKYAPEILD